MFAKVGSLQKGCPSNILSGTATELEPREEDIGLPQQFYSGQGVFDLSFGHRSLEKNDGLF